MVIFSKITKQFANAAQYSWAGFRYIAKHELAFQIELVFLSGTILLVQFIDISLLSDLIVQVCFVDFSMEGLRYR